MNGLTSDLVSIIIPVYNNERFIGETIQSVILQTYSNWELIIVDDGSTDNLKGIVDKFQKDDPRIKYYFHENSGVSAARNFGYKVSKGSIIAFLDSDDVWLPDNILLKIEKFKEKNYGMVHSDGVFIDENSNMLSGKLEGKEGRLLDGLLAWKETQVPGPSSILIKKNIIESVGLFDPGLSTSADFDFFIRIATRYEIGRVPHTTWKYRLHEKNMHRNIQFMEDNIIFIYKKSSTNHLFKNRKFEKKCYSNMYLTLGASWFGEGKSILKAGYWVFKSFITYPPVILEIIVRFFKK